MRSGRMKRLYGVDLEIEDVLSTTKPLGLAMLGARREGAFAVQVDVRKKVLWGRWAECVLAGARNRRGRETLPKNSGGDERAATVIDDSEQHSGKWGTCGGS